MNIAKYFKIFDSIEDIYVDLNHKFEENNYEINLEQIESKIVIKIKTNIYKSDFFLEIPIKNHEIHNELKEVLDLIKNNNNEIKQTLKEYNEKFEKLEKKINNLENIINSKIKYKPEIILFEKSTIIKNDYERKLLESFIKENDTSKK